MSNGEGNDDGDLFDKNSPKEQIAARYLKGHLETTGVENELLLTSPLMIPLEKVVYDPEGEVHINKDGLKLDFRYRTPSADLDMDKLPINKDLPEGGSKPTRPEEIRILEELSIERKGRTLKLSEALPPNCQIYFDPSRESLIDAPSSAVDTVGRKVMIFGDLTKLGNVASLFHEAGHLWDVDPEKNPEYVDTVGTSVFVLDFSIYEDSPFDNLMSNQVGEVVLKSERHAWAFALKRLKPFIDNIDSPINVKVLSVIIHNRCLKSYSDLIKHALNKIKSS